FITDNAGMPVVLRMKNIGDDGVGLSEAMITAVGALSGAEVGLTTGTASKIASVLSLGASDGVIGGINGAIAPWVTMVTFVCELALGAFLTLSLFIPLIPFLVYMGQIVSWLIGVIEGVAAAPFLAFAHLDASGEEGLGQRTNYGYTFMLQSFMRPVMLCFRVRDRIETDGCQ
ncbi:integral membrane protein, partial [mine drainage metagenome]